MKLLVETSVVFLGTLLAAAVVALGEPAQAEVELVQAAPASASVITALASTRP